VLKRGLKIPKKRIPGKVVLFSALGIVAFLIALTILVANLIATAN
jgi:hypothetical protein